MTQCDTVYTFIANNIIENPYNIFIEHDKNPDIQPILNYHENCDSVNILLNDYHERKIIKCRFLFKTKIYEGNFIIDSWIYTDLFFGYIFYFRNIGDYTIEEISL